MDRREMLRSHRTKIVCTIGPASQDIELMGSMIRAGMEVARLNFSHADEAWHLEIIRRLREASVLAGRSITLLGDLPGPKIRIGRLAKEPIWLASGGQFTLTTEEILGDHSRVTVRFPSLPQRLRPGNKVFLNDGLITLEVERVRSPEVQCRVTAGGELRSHKGLNLPEVDLGISAFTDQDSRWLAFALTQGVEAISQSFVERADDLRAVRLAAKELGKNPFLIAKIERCRALDRLEEIIDEADGIMIARGDLGVEMPVERVPLIQKEIIRKANELGKPVITATQMLESMTEHPRPTRAEAADVANAILDGTDCVMLSAESAAGRYPVEAVETLARIALAVESSSPGPKPVPLKSPAPAWALESRELLAQAIGAILERSKPAAIFVPTKSGATARSIARFRPGSWIVAVSSSLATCHGLRFSRGVHPIFEPEHPRNWREYAGSWLESQGIGKDLVLITEGPSSLDPTSNYRVEIMDLRGH